jgi:tetratricopeptide (TPR) repeat protein
MKKFVLLVAAMFLTGFCAGHAIEQVRVSADVQAAITKYKNGDYVGTVQRLGGVIAKTPNDVIAQYYLALAYTQLGMKDEAKAAFDAVIERDNLGGGLAAISQMALTCFEDSDRCHGKPGSVSQFVRSNEFLGTGARGQNIDAQLQQVRDSINSGEKQDFTNFRLLNDASGAMPTNDEIADAVKVLARAGLSLNNGGEQTFQSALTNADPKLMQLNALLGRSNNNSNNGFDMIPFIMSQASRDGSAPKVDTRTLQAMMVNQMMSSFSDNNNNNNRGWW